MFEYFIMCLLFYFCDCSGFLLDYTLLKTYFSPLKSLKMSIRVIFID